MMRPWWIRCASGAVIVAAIATGCDAQPDNQEVIGSFGEAGVSTCVALEACCPSLPSDVVSSCKKLAAQVSDDECGAEVSALQRAGHCVSDAGAGRAVDASVSTDAREPLGDGGVIDGGATAAACILLEVCCTSAGLPSSDSATCTSIQGEGVEEDCAGLLATLTASQYCGGTPPVQGGACAELEQCCTSESFPATDVMSCNVSWSEGTDAECGPVFAAYAAAGFCGQGVMVDGGPLLNSDCSTLGLCCIALHFPASKQSTCQQLASANIGGSCQSAYDSYATLGYCE